MFSNLNMNRFGGGSKSTSTGANSKAAGGGKRKAEVSPRKMEPITKKRSALGDLTNAVKKKALGGGTNKDKHAKATLAAVAAEKPVVRVTRSKSLVSEEPKETAQVVAPAKKGKTSQTVDKDVPVLVKAKIIVPEKLSVGPSKLPVRQTRASRTRISEEKENSTTVQARRVTRSSNSKPTVQDSSTSADDEEDSSLYKTAVSTPESDLSQSVEDQNRKNEQLSLQKKSKLPHGVVDFDAETVKDQYQVGLYAEEIFAYYKRRENRFHVKKYLDEQTELNRNMRSILVDWMVEVQESFELNHETMYLGVKIVDLFLSKTIVKREQLQLVGTTALYIAAKYDERCPPAIDDFCYICDDAYPTKEIIKMEMIILRSLNYDIGFPLSYRFVRRYSRCAKLDMDTLTLARYILEMSLMEYDFIDVKDSMLAASALLLALVMKKVKAPWSKTLEYYSGYNKEDLFDLTHRLHEYLTNVPSHLKTIRSKYSHKVFYEAAKVPLPDELKL
ncbi:G2/mitotic-specific cyclin-B3 [Folsomia candida]|uniref:G2/mitotic-specific cyclin-B3 n=1 Tax=Folsomia candida TaxID=158441 RepID=A0A226ERL6_FOLCA|nr:G2/mitotic-specific cyclin-B3 [Folsomia candida]XP_021944094.1 G2/mitotic-specific cyclin-B3 [Folsomia candida]XP_021944095.1 G2/mitotic-specific cyclin-B3 [Folsomia candida]OXA59694.1 G2/mitotic-specific cyclin-B3 [Folsomia candida]